jgi:fatty-acyl-CoA synthase
LPDLDCVVLGEAPVGARDWADFIRAGDSIGDDELDARRDAVDYLDPTIIVHTSGTTGHPKGAVHSHLILRNEHSIAEALLIDADSRVMNHMPFFHVAGGFTGILPSLICGGAILLMDSWDPAEALALIERERATVFSGIPTHFIDLVNHPRLSEFDTSSLRSGWIGGASNPREVIDAAIEQLGVTHLMPVYGMTETTALTSIAMPGDSHEVVVSGAGRPVADFEVKVEAPAGGDELGPGVEGEVCVRGHVVMQGYYGDPQATAKAIDGDGWFHTGDLGVLDDRGYLSITGRITDMFIVGGNNAYPAEIEAALGEHPAVKQAYVVGVPHERLGEVGYAFVELRGGIEADTDELGAFCKARLADFKVPRSMVLVQDWPLTATGKVERVTLREWAREAATR